jgi:hypothetical protein
MDWWPSRNVLSWIFMGRVEIPSVSFMRYSFLRVNLPHSIESAKNMPAVFLLLSLEGGMENRARFGVLNRYYAITVQM